MPRALALFLTVFSLTVGWRNELVRRVHPESSVVRRVLTQMGIFDEVGTIRRLQRRNVVCERTWLHSSRWAFHAFARISEGAKGARNRRLLPGEASGRPLRIGC
jgi:hypothetical protein